MTYVTPNSINDDFTQRVIVDTLALPWSPSPQSGVERRFLDRVGGEVARATSLVRYAPGSVFPSHTHDGGEEYFVLEGVFSDEHGDYPAGTYVRNPPGTAHAPATKDGCVILVKLRQMRPQGEPPVLCDTNRGDWRSAEVPGHYCLSLFEPQNRREQVTLERLDAGTDVPPRADEGGEEIFVLEGAFSDNTMTYEAGTWIRNPCGYQQAMMSEKGCTLWVKRGHLLA